MAKVNTLSFSIKELILSKIRDYAQLIKLRLTSLVVFSAGVGFAIASYHPINWEDLSILLLSGFLITGSANGINQIIERKLDALMSRTNRRPLATGRIKPVEAAMLTAFMGMLGAFLLGAYINALSAFIGMLSLIIYAFIYTPLKQKTRLSVIAGAFSGAAPPVIGYTAAFGSIDELCLLLFAIQFVWQLPHFWAVAWILDDDYKKAGFRLLPTRQGRGIESARYIFLSTSLLLPICIYFITANYVGIIIGILIVAASTNFLYQSYSLLKTRKLKDARKLMFGSFYYLPIVQILILTGIILIR